MSLTIEDMTREVNVFNLRKQPRNIEDQTFEVTLIENLTSEHREELELETESEFELESMNFNLDQIVEPINLSPSIKSSHFIELKSCLSILSTST